MTHGDVLSIICFLGLIGWGHVFMDIVYSAWLGERRFPRTLDDWVPYAIAMMPFALLVTTLLFFVILAFGPEPRETIWLPITYVTFIFRDICAALTILFTHLARKRQEVLSGDP